MQAKKKTMRVCALSLLPLCTGLLFSCASSGGSQGTDPTKATLSIGTLDAGIGGGWLEEAAERFNELNKDRTDFEEGKTGVQVTVTANRSYDGDYLLKQNWKQDVMFTEAINYYALVNSGKAMDITELMNADLSSYGDAAGTTILSKLDSSISSFLNKGGKYYAIPFYDAFYGFVYDVDLWKEDGLYFSTTGSFTKDLTKLSAGPDGESGTYDDGMPATYDDMKILLNKLKTDYGKAFVISTDEHEYVANMFFNWWAMNEGYDGMNLQFKLNSQEAGGIKAKNLVKTTNSDGTAASYYDETEITYDNAYMLQRSEGKLKVLKFLEETICSPSNGTSYYELRSANTDAQSYFVSMKYKKGTACPMALEGSWFTNEASSVIDSIEKKYGSKGNYAMMPIPRAAKDEVGTEQTSLEVSQSYGLVSSNCKNTKLACEFLKFLHSDQELINFTKSTGMTRALNYKIPSSESEGLSTFTQSLINRKSGNRIFYPYANNDIAVNNYSDFGRFHWAWNSSVEGNNGTQTNPWTFFRNADSTNKTAVKYFDGCYDYFQKNWSRYNR